MLKVNGKRQKSFMRMEEGKDECPSEAIWLDGGSEKK